MKIKIRLENRSSIIVQTTKEGCLHSDYVILPMINSGVARNKAADLANAFSAEQIDANTWETK